MQRAFWRVAALACGLVVLTGVAAGMAQAQAPTQGQAGLRVANMAPGAPAQVDVHVDGQRVMGPVAYQTVSTLQNVPPGAHEIRITPAGQSDPTVLSTRQDMAANRTYTVVVTGGPGDLRPVVVEDDLTPAPDGRGRLRFVNAVPNTRVNVVTDAGETLFPNVDYRAITDFREVPAGTYTLRVRDANTNTELTTVPNVVVPSRGSAAAFATGTAQFGGAPVQQAPAGMGRTGTGGLVLADAQLSMPAALGVLAATVVLLAGAGAGLGTAVRRRQGV